MITAKDVEWIYEVPLVFHEEGLDAQIVEKLQHVDGSPNLQKWQKTIQVLKDPKSSVKHRRRWQVHEPQGVLQEPLRGAGSRRYRQRDES